MRKVLFLFTALLFWLGIASCAPESETLLLYTNARNTYREGRFREAAEMLDKENNFAPSLVLRGKAEYLSGDLTAAGNSLKRALKAKPHDAEASLFLARIFREAGNISEARKLADKILADNPLEIRTLRFAAELARERGVKGEAASAVLLDRAAEASAELALVFLDRARSRWTRGNRAGALEDLGRAKALLASGSPVLKAVLKLESIINGGLS